MPKTARAPCARCGARLRAGPAFCRACGAPTQWASPEQRIAWELAEWRRAREAHRPSPAPPVARPPAPPATSRARPEEDLPSEAVTRLVLRALAARVRELEERVRALEARPSIRRRIGRSAEARRARPA